MRRFAFALALLVSTTSSAVASAGGDASSTAEELFQKAKGLIGQNKWSEACPLLAESYRLDPAGGTLQNLAVCYESAGKWASAYARFQELKTLAKRATPPKADRVKFCDDHLAKVTPKVAHLVVVSDETTAEVEIEGVKYERTSWAAGIALDPGAHDVLLSVAGKKPYRGAVTIPNEGTEQKLQIPVLEVIPVDPPPSLVDERRTKDEQAERKRLEDQRRLRRMGYFVGGAGLLALAGSGVVGFFTVRKSHEGRDKCNGPLDDERDGNGHCYTGLPLLDRANDAKASARTLAVVTDVLAAAGIVAVGAGVYLAFVRGGSAEKAASLRIAPTIGGAIAMGTF